MNQRDQSGTLRVETNPSPNKARLFGVCMCTHTDLLSAWVMSVVFSCAWSYAMLPLALAPVCPDSRRCRETTKTNWSTSLIGRNKCAYHTCTADNMLYFPFVMLCLAQIARLNSKTERREGALMALNVRVDPVVGFDAFPRNSSRICYLSPWWQGTACLVAHMILVHFCSTGSL